MYNWLKAICIVCGVPIGIIVFAAIVKFTWTNFIEPNVFYIMTLLFIIIFILIICGVKQYLDMKISK